MRCPVSRAGAEVGRPIKIASGKGVRERSMSLEGGVCQRKPVKNGVWEVPRGP